MSLKMYVHRLSVNVPDQPSFFAVNVATNEQEAARMLQECLPDKTLGNAHATTWTFSDEHAAVTGVRRSLRCLALLETCTMLELFRISPHSTAEQRSTARELIRRVEKLACSFAADDLTTLAALCVHVAEAARIGNPAALRVDFYPRNTAQG